MSKEALDDGDLVHVGVGRDEGRREEGVGVETEFDEVGVDARHEAVGAGFEEECEGEFVGDGS